MTSGRTSAADALLLIAPGCAHCPVVLEELSKLIKQGKIGRLEVVNVAEHPEVAEQVGSRSVPWTRIGHFEFTGVLSHAELLHWISLATQETGLAEYYSHLLETGQLDTVILLLGRPPHSLHQLVSLLFKKQLPMAVRIGIGAVLEEFQGGQLINDIISDLIELTTSQHAQTRADACHYLGLTGNPQIIPVVEHLIEDKNAEVREIAMETLELLKTSSYTHDE